MEAWRTPDRSPVEETARIWRIHSAMRPALMAMGILAGNGLSQEPRPKAQHGFIARVVDSA